MQTTIWSKGDDKVHHKRPGKYGRRCGYSKQKKNEAIDSPTPRNKTQTHVHILLTDLFSRRADMFVVSAAQLAAAGTADIFLNECIPLWGCPVTLLSDSGLHFTSKLANIVYDRLGIHKVNTSSYHPCTNGGVERVNHVLAQMLSIVGNEQQTEWDVLLPHVPSAYNNSVNAATGLAHNKILVGRLPKAMG